MTPFDNVQDAELEDLEDLEEEEDFEESDMYWALKKGSEIVSELDGKERAFFDAVRRRGLMRMWRMQYANYFGQDVDAIGGFETQSISIAGEDGELLTFRLNEMRSLVTRQIQMAVGERAAFQSVASNSDYKSRSQVELCDAIVTYVYREAHAERREHDIVEGDSNFGYTFGWARWDTDGGDEVEVTEQAPIDPGNPAMGSAPLEQTHKSGAPTVTTVYPWELIRESNSKNHLWSCVRERASKYELAAQYPEFGEKIRAMSELDEYTTERLFGLQDSESETDDVIVRHFYHERCSAIPSGRYLGVVGDIVLWDESAPVAKGLPLKEMCSARFIGTSFGFASAWDLNAPNQMIDQIMSDAASNFATFGRQVIAMYDGTEFDLDALANGHRALTIPSGGELPQALSFAQIPPSAFQFIDLLLSRMEAISGINSVSRGDPASNISSGTMAALFHEIAIEFQQQRQTAFDEYREGMANLLLDLVRTNAQGAFVAEISGDDERPNIQQFMLTDIAGVRKVVVKTANPMMRSVAGRMEIFNAVKGIPNPQDRAAAIDLLVTGNTKGFTEHDQSETLWIKRENEILADGMPVPVAGFEDHKRHYRSHRAEYMSRREAFLTDPEQRDAHNNFLEHIQAHMIAYYNMNPIFAEWNEMQPPPMYRGMTGPPPANDNMAPAGAMDGGSGGGGQAGAAAVNVVGKQPSDPAEATGAEQPQPAQPAQAPGGPAQNPGEAA